MNKPKTPRYRTTNRYNATRVVADLAEQGDGPPPDMQKKRSMRRAAPSHVVKDTGLEIDALAYFSVINGR
jgi:hypothetical protein